MSTSGVLVYRPGDSETNAGSDLELRIVDRTGKVVSSTGGGWPYRGLDLSPDGSQVVNHRHEERGGDVWLTDLKGGSSRLTFDPTQHNISPVWSPDGAAIAFASLRNGSWGIYRKAANNVGAEERLLDSKVVVLPVAWSTKNEIVYVRNDPQTLFDIWRLPLTGDRTPVLIVNGPTGESHGQTSPDGRWLAYVSGRTVFVQDIYAPATKYQVSDAGRFPRWRDDGKEILFMSPNSGRMMSAAVNTAGNGLTFSSTFLFDSEHVNFTHAELGGGPYHTFDVSADGQRFVVPIGRRVGLDSESPLVVVLNWDANLRR
jgi:Tol biopolymer transport system component